MDEIRTVLGTDFGQAWPTLQKKFTATDAGLFYNKRMEEEKLKRRKFTDSRRNNLNSKKTDHMGDHMGNRKGVHMENENNNEVLILGVGSRKIVNHVGLIPDMVTAFLEKFPAYPSEPEKDFEACLDIAYSIGGKMNLTQNEITGKKKSLVIAEWKRAVEFISRDKWFKTRSLSGICKQWQEVIMSMNSILEPQAAAGKKSMVH